MNQKHPETPAPHDFDRRVGVTLREFMNVTGVGRNPIAAALGVSPAYITHITNGHKPLLREHLRPIARVLQINPDAIALEHELKERGRPRLSALTEKVPA